MRDVQLAVDPSAYDTRRTHDGAYGFAENLATYISDPSRIRSLTLREFGFAPSVERCAEMRADHERGINEFRRLSTRPIDGFSADNDDGASFRVRGLVKPEKPKPAPRKVPLAFIQTVERQIAVRNENAIVAGPIAREVIFRVADHFNVDADELVGHRKGHYLISARWVVIRLMAEIKDAKGGDRFSKSHIGRIMGGRDHTTITHALDYFDDRARKHTVMTDAYLALSV